MVGCSSVASFLVLGGGGGGKGARGDKTPKCTDKKSTYTARASASETYIFRTQNTSACTINAVSFKGEVSPNNNVD